MSALDPAVWPRSAEVDAAGRISVGGLAVTELAERFGTPLYVLDENDFRSRCREWRAAFADFPNGATVYYAGKAFL